MTTLSATRAQATRSPASAERAASNPNAILSQYQPTGASSATARQDGLPGGVGASQKMARTDLPKIKQYADEFAAAGQKYGVPPALLAAIASRESRGGSSGNDMGVVRNNGRTTHNYQDMNSIIYRDCKDVVILVPKGAIQRD